MRPTHLIPSLEPKLCALLERHRERAAAVDWAYPEYLPLAELRANPQSLPQLSDTTYLAVETALLTEVNLPWFTTGLCSLYKGSLAPMRQFVYDWTAEEDQHAQLLETYLLLGDNGDHRERARLRKLVIRQGWAPTIEDEFEAMAYTSMQELATRAFYQRVAQACRHEDPLLARALNRLAKDETLHYAFYRDAVKAHLEVRPSYAEPLARVMIEFSMPGAEMPDYALRSVMLARAGVFGPDHYYSMVVEHLWREWDIDSLHPRGRAAREALQQLGARRQKLASVAERFAARAKHPTITLARNGEALDELASLPAASSSKASRTPG